MAVTTLILPQIRDSAISSAKLRDSAVTARKVANSTLTAAKVANSTLTGAKIQNSTLTAAKIANATISGTKVATSTLTAANIANSTLTGKKFVDSTVTKRKIANSAITSAKISPSGLTLAKLRVNGNAIFLGTTTFIGATNLVVTDPIIEVGHFPTGVTGVSAITRYNGLEVDRGSATNAAILWDEQNNKWYVNDGTGLKEIQLVGSAGFTFVDNELKTVGAGTTVTVFQLANTPVPSSSLKLYFNGQRWHAGGGNDFTLTNSTVTMLAASLTSADKILSDYRY